VATSRELPDAKLSVPWPGPRSVRRTDLIRQLRANRDRRVISIVAPPGYGKTTALAQWASDRRDPVPWIMVDDGDNDPVALFTDIAIALDRRAPLDPTVLDLLSAPGVSIHSMVGRLLAGASARAIPIRFVLDDVHRLTDRTCLDALGELIARLPPGGQVAIAGREDVDLPIARWRSQGALLEVGTDELAFDLDETHTLLRQAGLDPTIDQIRVINEQSEGWPAGIYLAAIATGSPEPTTVGPVPSGGDRYIADYLRAEVLGSLDEPTVSFLRRTAILDQVSGSSCNAVAQVRDATSTLERLAAANRLIIPLDSRRVWYRYHTLLREFLMAELERTDPAIMPELHRRASVWYERHGQSEQAIDHAFAAGDSDRAARLFGGIVMEFHYSGRTATARAILDRFDHRQLHRDPWLATLGAISAMFNGETGSADQMEAIVDHSTYEGIPPDGSASFESLRATLRVFRGRGGVNEMQENADIAVNQEPASSVFRGWALNCRAIAAMAAGDGSSADADLVEAVAAARASKASEDEQLALAGRAMLAIDAGGWGRARELVALADAVIAASHLESYALTAFARAGSARVAIHDGDLDRARERLSQGALLRPLLTHAMPWFSVRSLLELARAHLALADPAGARAVLRQAEEILVKEPGLGTVANDVHTLRRQLQGLPIGTAGASTLTAAELRVLAFMPLHLTFREIGERLGVKPSTVKTHSLSVYAKLGASSRSEAVVLAVAAGLLEGAM